MKKYFLTLIVTAVLAGLIGAVSGQEVSKEDKRSQRKAARQLLKKAIDQVEAEKYDLALPLLDSVVIFDTRNADAFYYRGIIYLKTTDTASALSTLSDGIALAPMSSRLKILKARILINQNDHESAGQLVESILALKPNEPETQYLKGLIAVSKADTTLALDSFEKALRKALDND